MNLTIIKNKLPNISLKKFEAELLKLYKETSEASLIQRNQNISKLEKYKNILNAFGEDYWQYSV